MWYSGSVYLVYHTTGVTGVQQYYIKRAIASVVFAWDMVGFITYYNGRVKFKCWGCVCYVCNFSTRVCINYYIYNLKIIPHLQSSNSYCTISHQ